jgi:hypothetical protein
MSSFGFLKKIENQTNLHFVLEPYLFEVFRNQRTCCSGLFFLLNSESKEPLVAGFSKKIKEPRGL